MARKNHFLPADYAEAAQAYLHSLPIEHFGQAVGQAEQRIITLSSLSLLTARRPDFQLFNELLVQWPGGQPARICQVVPDNMVVLHDERIRAKWSFDVPYQPVGPFWVLDYLSDYTNRKDYDDNFQKCERELKVPYYLRFHSDTRELSLFRHSPTGYVAVQPNEAGRYALPEVEIEVGLTDAGARFWFRGELLLLPAELQRELDDARRQTEELRLDEARRRAEASRLRLEETRRRAEKETRRAEDARRRCDEAEREIARMQALLDQALLDERQTGER